ncbi:NAD(P)/FAD-dependent oxidoreductase [Nocardia sp. JMUB6875]|uniref:flavin-containing monooxygenase n=1 Tax=Nocardia sp. JMUB6875 TaxID=3158170 RepID=UPI0032E55973
MAARAGVRHEPPEYEVAIIGAGAGGICAGVKLKDIGVTDIVIIDRAPEMGGTWLFNTYPGVGADLPAVAYQFSFARKHDWSRIFAKGKEIQDYHLDIARHAGLYQKVRLNTDIVKEEWDEANHLWRLHVSDGTQITARFVISAVGAYLRPKDAPAIAGLERFGGEVMIPSRWNHDYDFTGKRVAIVGVGSSTVQIAPALAPLAAQLDVYQRTTQWYFPKPDMPMYWWMKLGLRIPGLAAALHGVALAGVEVGLRGLVYMPNWLMRLGSWPVDSGARTLYRGWLRYKVRDPRVRAKLVPGYGPGCTRGTLGGDYLPIFNRPNVELVSDPIARITEDAIVSADGTERPVDTLVLATGYEVFSDPESYREDTVIGADGFDLGKFFNSEGLQAYHSTAIAGLPNRWMMVGPYSWTGTAFHYILENAMRNINRAIDTARTRGATRTEVRLEAQQRFHRQVLRRGRNLAYYFSVHCAGSNTYFVNSHGDSPYVRPASLLQSRREGMNYPLDDYTYETLKDTDADSLAPIRRRGNRSRKLSGLLRESALP